MVYDIQDYWVFGLCLSSGILKTQKKSKNPIVLKSNFGFLFV
jgi:hypothetical protein